MNENQLEGAFDVQGLPFSALVELNLDFNQLQTIDGIEASFQLTRLSVYLNAF